MFSTLLSNNDSFTVTTPDLLVKVPQGGRFRVDAANGNSWVTVLKGDVTVDSGSGSTKVNAGHMLATNGADQVNVEPSPAPDDFDTWTLDRDRALYAGDQQALPYLNAYSPCGCCRRRRSFELWILGRCARHRILLAALWHHCGLVAIFRGRMDVLRRPRMDVDQLRTLGLATLSLWTLDLSPGKWMGVVPRAFQSLPAG